MKNQQRDDEFLQGQGILIAEDSIVQSAKLKIILEEQGYQVRAAASGVQALEVLHGGFHPWLIISDIVMPRMSGYELCKHVRKDEQLKDIPFILLTSLSDLKDIIKGLECGANSFIVKPYDAENLISRIRHLQANLALHRKAPPDADLQVLFSGETFKVTADKPQILDFLLSIYEDAYRNNLELRRVEEELRMLNEELEKRVQERTAALMSEIVERKRAEAEARKHAEDVRIISQQLWQAEKLATVGELSAGIAHELNNPLAIISLRVESLADKTPADSSQQRELAVIGQEIDRMSSLIANLLQFSRRGQQQISTVEVSEEIEKTLEFIHYHLRKHNIKCVTEFTSGTPKIRADRQQLRQLFLNLLMNAGDAMPQGGSITLRVAPDRERKSVRIEIADTGMGIPPELLEKVTEPFYTTKQEGKGTGLGLAICRRIVREHRGTLEMASAGIPGQGTTVRIILPVTSHGNADYLEA